MILSSCPIATLSLPDTVGGFCNPSVKDIDFTLHANQSDYNSVAHHNNSGRIDK
jgi:hypothetical protein